jgi:hypothetical protein
VSIEKQARVTLWECEKHGPQHFAEFCGWCDLPLTAPNEACPASQQHPPPLPFKSPTAPDQTRAEDARAYADEWPKLLLEQEARRRELIAMGVPVAEAWALVRAEAAEAELEKARAGMRLFRLRHEEVRIALSEAEARADHYLAIIEQMARVVDGGAPRRQKIDRLREILNRAREILTPDSGEQ